MNTEDHWFALAVTVDAEASEAIEFALNELDALGTEINNLGAKQTETLTVIGYFRQPPEDDEAVQATLVEALRIYSFAPAALHKTEWRRIGKVDWLYDWKKHWKATESGKFIVAPPWEKIENTDKIIIRIEPNMAFGTGTHETTRLCLQAVGDNFQSEMSFLDVGTGTGILAIAVAKLNSQNSKILGCDTDVGSIAIAAENAEANEVGDQIEFRVGSISETDSAYDFVCANLTIDVIVPILPLLVEKSKQVLVLSGILKEQQELIVSELRNLNIENPEIEVSGEWIAVKVNRRQ